MRIAGLWAAGALAVGLTACGGQYAPCEGDCSPPGEGDLFGPTTGGDSGSADAQSGGGQEGIDKSDLPSDDAAGGFCSKDGDFVDIWTEQAIRSSLVGWWLFCDGGSLFQHMHDGIVFDADGRWAFLAWAEGHLQRSKGFDGEGTWQLTDVSSTNGQGPLAWQLDIWQSGSIPALLQFTVDPAQMRINYYPGEHADYVAIQPQEP